MAGRSTAHLLSQMGKQEWGCCSTCYKQLQVSWQECKLVCLAARLLYGKLEQSFQMLWSYQIWGQPCTQAPAGMQVQHWPDICCCRTYTMDVADVSGTVCYPACQVLSCSYFFCHEFGAPVRSGVTTSVGRRCSQAPMSSFQQLSEQLLGVNLHLQPAVVVTADHTCAPNVGQAGWQAPSFFPVAATT